MYRDHSCREHTVQLLKANSLFHSRHSEEEEVLTQGTTYLPLSRGPEEPSCGLFFPEERRTCVLLLISMI